jgi:hypothetical protein
MIAMFQPHLNVLLAAITVFIILPIFLALVLHLRALVWAETTICPAL